GNLVFVHRLTAAGHEPSAIRLGVFASHYRSDRDWSDLVLSDAEERLASWRRALEDAGSSASAQAMVQEVRARLADDLDSPGALAAVDAWAASDRGETGEGVADLVRDALDALLGVQLR